MRCASSDFPVRGGPATSTDTGSRALAAKYSAHTGPNPSTWKLGTTSSAPSGEAAAPAPAAAAATGMLHFHSACLLLQLAAPSAGLMSLLMFALLLLLLFCCGRGPLREMSSADTMSKNGEEEKPILGLSTTATKVGHLSWHSARSITWFVKLVR